MYSGKATYVSGHADRVRAVAKASSLSGHAPFAASWKRSLLHHKIDPETTPKVSRLETMAIHEHREAAGRLLHVAAPSLDRLARAAGEAGCTVLLTDTNGLVLDERVRDADRSFFADTGLMTGTDWSESREGTNGIGTCAAEMRPVLVHRDQHFRTRNTGLTCMGAPIFGATGELAGVIDVSSARDDMSEAYARFVALTVQDAAYRIEADLFRDTFAGLRIITANADENAGAVMLLAVDRDDIVTGATRAARRKMGICPDMIGRVPAADLLGGSGETGLEAAQRAEMNRALMRCGGNVSAAARILGISRATFYRKAASLGLKV